MHLTLINPPFTFNHKATVNYSQCLGILYIAANVSAHDHHVMVIDALMEGKDNRQPLSDTLVQIGLNHADTAARIIADTDVIGVSVPFSHLGNIAFELIKEIKKQFPNTPIVMGGVFPSTQPQLAMDSKADFLILGEGEQSMVQLMEHLRAGSTGKLSEGIISTHQPLEPQRAISRFVSDLDQLPFPARDLIPFDKYVGYSQRERTKRRSASLITSRGCPFKCEFCSVHPVCGFEYRPHSAKRVLAEIDHLVDQYQVSRFEIEDDNFTLHRQRAEEILEGIIERNAKVPT
jgi:magnesium-protoporphyrin IX monomethyl ester (oxidative) cyclase